MHRLQQRPDSLFAAALMNLAGAIPKLPDAGHPKP